MVGLHPGLLRATPSSAQNSNSVFKLMVDLGNKRCAGD